MSIPKKVVGDAMAGSSESSLGHGDAQCCHVIVTCKCLRGDNLALICLFILMICSEKILLYCTPILVLYCLSVCSVPPTTKLRRP